ncbi:3'-5' exoribonuclease domain-containing protein [Neolewinella agarilytica]|uniref:3'-5' exoribonuclease Rv2179c-like domain-containing protein n=1 Tax=Neolewinella agarilytica TaxID=478744 RepID=A0A1H9HBT6_9BACT|nr:3'-5' exoribonuclease [Neolewinella agarilytica]SEQ59736.1 protein of unknown function [Neolewinella agarilytica]
MQHIFLDTEFSGLHQNAALLSLAIVPDEGPWFYAVFTDVDTTTLSPWHQNNVVPHLLLTDEQRAQLPTGIYLRDTPEKITHALRKYLEELGEVVCWADVPAYDWVLLCELFGGAFGLPKNVHYIVRDLATLLEAKGYDIDTDRFDLAYENHQGADAGARVSSADGRVGEGQKAAATQEGLLRHNALGDAMACKICWQKVNEHV